ncbi:MAG: hypothetical protein WCJ51_04400 [Candidatus Moraniibacteriota bacterium]
MTKGSEFNSKKIVLISEPTQNQHEVPACNHIIALFHAFGKQKIRQQGGFFKKD